MKAETVSAVQTITITELCPACRAGVSYELRRDRPRECSVCGHAITGKPTLDLELVRALSRLIDRASQ